jgi:hypothetical protein
MSCAQRTAITAAGLHAASHRAASKPAADTPNGKVDRRAFAASRGARGRGALRGARGTT